MQATTGKAPSSLDWDDLSEKAISAFFLDHLETDRHNGPRTRNLRLTAIGPCSATPPCATPSTPP